MLGSVLLQGTLAPGLDVGMLEAPRFVKVGRWGSHAGDLQGDPLVTALPFRDWLAAAFTPQMGYAPR